MKLFILGAGGHARETYCHILDINPLIEILFIDDVSEITEINIKNKKITVIKSWDDVKRLQRQGFHLFTVGIGTPKFKPLFVKKALEADLHPADTWIHPSSIVQDAQIGKGGMIAPGSIITTSVLIGDYVTINYKVSIGHDSVLGDYVSCNPGSSISGNAFINEGCLVGAGAVIREKINIAKNVTVGAQACVVKDITLEGSVVVGVPAELI